MSGPAQLKRVEPAPIVPRKTAWVLGALALFCLIGGVVSMWRSYSERKRLNNTDARISYSEVVSFGKVQPRYRLQVEFVYIVARERFLVPYSFPYDYSNRKAADNDALRYRSGSVHRIFYYPEQPYNILLNPESSGRFFVLPLLLTVVGVILGGSLVFMYLRGSSYFCVACGTNVERSHAFCHHCGRRIPVRKGRLRV
jgi:hypothetical protein